jgi:hypothetical protein
MKKIVLLFISLISNFLSYSSSCSSSGSGNWNSPSTWSCGHVPVCGDIITISAGTTVTVSDQIDYTACVGPFTLQINGILLFTTGNKLKLSTGSIITLSASGSIVPGGGGGSSNLIDIGGVDVWSAGYGTATGPIIITQFTPLPIELISFTAKFVNKEVELNWITSSETNNDYFTIQKTLNGTDFEFVGKVQGAGNSSSQLNYSFTDHSPYEGKSYYRLMQTDFNGASAVFSLVPVEIEVESEFTFDIYPNPVNGNDITISINQKEAAEVLVVVYDITGKESYSKVMVTEVSGNNIYALDNLNRLPVGMYIITATSDQKIYSKRLIVQ